MSLKKEVEKILTSRGHDLYRHFVAELEGDWDRVEGPTEQDLKEYDEESAETKMNNYDIKLANEALQRHRKSAQFFLKEAEKRIFDDIEKLLDKEGFCKLMSFQCEIVVKVHHLAKELGLSHSAVILPIVSGLRDNLLLAEERKKLPDNFKMIQVQSNHFLDCDCGAEKTKTPGHSSWCSKFESK